MSTVASLGFAVDSSQALKASQNLDRLTASAAKTEAGEKRLSAETKTAEKSVAAFTRETMRSAAALQSAKNARARATASTAAHGAAASMMLTAS